MSAMPEAIRRLVELWSADGRSTQPSMAWPRERWIRDFPGSTSALVVLPERLDRAAVINAAARAAESPQAAVDAFLVVMAWGYGDTVGYGRYRTVNILASRPDAGERLQWVARLLADADVFAAHRALSSPGLAQLRGLGPSFGSKVLYFFQPPDRRPRALILDAFVAGWLAREAGQAFDASQWSLDAYRRYVGKMHEWADALGIEPDELEMVIFRAEAARRGSQWATPGAAPLPEPAEELRIPPAVPATGLPFAAYPGGGRVLQGAPAWGNGSARRGYGVKVLAWCGYECAYCGLDMATFEGWLQFSVDHVIPQQMQTLAGYKSEWVLDSINLVAACSACNGFLNRDPATGPAPVTLEAFCDLRDAVFLLRREKIEKRRDAERAWFDERIAPAAVEVAARRAPVSDAALGTIAGALEEGILPAAARRAAALLADPGGES